MFRGNRSGRFDFFALIFVFFILVMSASHGFLFFEDEISVYNLDDSGDVDVVILTASSGALGFGHTALLFNRDDSWFYFSWQASKVVFVEVPSFALSGFDSFNEWIREENSIQSYIADFDSAILVRGDFEESLLGAESLFLDYLSYQGIDDVDSSDYSFSSRNREYNLFFNNCVIVSWGLLSLGLENVSSSDDFGSFSFISNVAGKQFESFFLHEPFFSK